jgi:hypothetical protein
VVAAAALPQRRSVATTSRTPTVRVRAMQAVTSARTPLNGTDS